MTTQEIVETNFTKYLEETNDLSEIKQIIKFMRNNLIRQDRAVQLISLDEYISFFTMIPKKYWSTEPIFYFRKGKFDALGFLGERPHDFNIVSKTLSIYYSEGVGIRLVDILDNCEKLYSNISCQKERVLKSLKDLKKKLSENRLKILYRKSRQICDGRYY